MNPSARRLAALASLACALAAPPCVADSLASSASSASSAGSASLGSLSHSIGDSSDASSRRTQVASGDYRIVEMAELGERPGLLRLRLQPLDADGGRRTALRLDVPRATVAQQRLATGDVVTARKRPYGWEFAHAAGAAFFLVLADDWLHELAPRAVAL